jgi:hypothetical protein
MKYPKIIAVLLLLITAAATTTRAQEFGGNPPSVKWQQIDLAPAKVIFPVGLDSAGRLVANIILQMNGAIKGTIGPKQKQISILMQNQTTIANGYVGLAPFRSEFYLTPEQNSFDIGSLSWPEQLAIHEFRHVQQYNNFNVGASHVMKILFGEGGQAVANDLAIPNWFFEGDAVFNETHVSMQGRGRLPYFLNGMRILWADGREYSYAKIRNGSYLDYTPDWYPLGYMMVSYGRDKYGDDLWKKVTHDAAAYKHGFFPFQKAIKNYTGEDFTHFSNDAFGHYKKVFDIDAYVKNAIGESLHSPQLVTAASLISNKHQHFIADREYPVYVNDSTMIYMKSTYDHIPVFVVKSGTTEKKIAVRSVSLDTYFAYHDGKIVYAAYRPDLRWNYRDYSELMLLDVASGKEHRLTKTTKYFAPDFSADGKLLVAVKEGTNGKCDVHLLDASTGKLVSIVPNPGNLFYTYPKFYGNGQLIAAIRTPKGKMTLDLIDIKTGKDQFLLPLSYQPIVFPQLKNDTIYYSATYGIEDRLFALSIKTGKLVRLDNYNLNGSVGNYEAAVGNDKFAYVGFTAFGYQVNELDKKDLLWTPINPADARGNLPDFGVSALTRDSSTDLLDRVRFDSLKVTKYRKSHHLLNFHSLIPNFNDPNYTLSLEGENVLNTLQSELSFNYNRDEGYKQFGFDAVYGALFPYLSGGADYYISRRGLYNTTNIYWNETDIHGGFQLPLSFSEGKNFTSLQAGTDIYYSSVDFQQPFQSMFANTSYAYLSYYLDFSNGIQQAKQNIYPRFGQTLELEYKSAITGMPSEQFLANGYLYLPGLSINHSTVLNFAYQQRNQGDVIAFSNDFPFSRGYTAEDLDNMYKAGINYNFPIAYPDAGFADFYYLQRIRLNPFYDYTYTTDYADKIKFKNTFQSAGLEVYFDSMFFNQESVSFGFRYSYLVNPDVFGPPGRNRFEIIVPVTVF